MKRSPVLDEVLQGWSGAARAEAATEYEVLRVEGVETDSEILVDPEISFSKEALKKVKRDRVLLDELAYYQRWEALLLKQLCGLPATGRMAEALERGAALQQRAFYLITLQYAPPAPEPRAPHQHKNLPEAARACFRYVADVALLQLAVPAAGKAPAVLGMPNIPIQVGGRFTIAGVGVTVRGDGKSGGSIRVAGLIASGKPGTLQIRLVDPVGQGVRDGLGACTGDSGAPVFEDKQGGPVIVGVVSWSTGPNGSDGCGGITGVTPLTLYRDWVMQTALQWGASF